MDLGAALEALRRCSAAERVDVDLGGQTVTDADLAQVAREMVACSGVIRIHIPSDKVTDASVHEIVCALRQGARVERLHICFPRVTAAAATCIFEAAASHSSLQELRFSYTHLCDEGARAAAKLLQSNMNIRELWLDHASIGDDGAETISAALASARSLQVLRLGGNDIADRGANALAAALPHCTALRILHLSGNPLRDSGVCAIGEALAKNSSLDSLAIADNLAASAGIRSLCLALEARETPCYVQIGGMDIDEPMHQDILSWICTNFAIQKVLQGSHVVDLGSSQWGAPHIRKLVRFFSTDVAARITKLRLARVPAETSARRSLLDFLFHCPSLEEVDISLWQESEKDWKRGIVALLACNSKDVARLNALGVTLPPPVLGPPFDVSAAKCIVILSVFSHIYDDKKVCTEKKIYSLQRGILACGPSAALAAVSVLARDGAVDHVTLVHTALRAGHFATSKEPMLPMHSSVDDGDTLNSLLSHSTIITQRRAWWSPWKTPVRIRSLSWDKVLQLPRDAQSYIGDDAIGIALCDWQTWSRTELPALRDRVIECIEDMHCRLPALQFVVVVFAATESKAACNYAPNLPPMDDNGAALQDTALHTENSCASANLSQGNDVSTDESRVHCSSLHESLSCQVAQARRNASELRAALNGAPGLQGVTCTVAEFPYADGAAFREKIYEAITGHTSAMAGVTSHAPRLWWDALDRADQGMVESEIETLRSASAGTVPRVWLQLMGAV